MATPRDSRRGPTRRQLLTSGAAAGAGAVATFAAIRAVGGTTNSDPTFGETTYPFYGAHQQGLLVAPQAHIVLLGFDLKSDTSAVHLRRMMRLLTDDAARLTQGQVPLADIESELTHLPAGLTVTFGFGPELVRRAGGEIPNWLAPLPDFEIDDLRPEYSDGDFLIDIAGDDPVTVAHAQRLFLRDARTFANPRWAQRGFRRARGSEPSGQTMRNLFGQVDGTINPALGSEDFDELLWIQEGWLAGGTSMVSRRIAMDMDGWDQVDRIGRENAVGRTLDNGAPITGGEEVDMPNFDARDDLGFEVINPAAHIRRAQPTNARERIYRRGYNYDDAPSPKGESDTGLLFLAYQANVTEQFLPIQQRLAEADLMNLWTTPIGSSVFAIPPGCEEGGYIGETLLEPSGLERSE